MQRDVMAGKPFELEAHNGYLARLGGRCGIPTPVHEFIYAALLPQLQRAQAGAQ
jgi:2-dehydropantoate 2-reductase